MWLFFGSFAIVTALMNLYRYYQGKDSTLWMYLSLAATALTVTASNHLYSLWVTTEDWSALMDVVPTMSKAFWVLVVLSIMLNGIPLFNKKIKGKER